MPSGTSTILHTFTGGADSGAPGALIYHEGALYGATGDGVAGTVFKIALPGGAYTVRHSFACDANGEGPTALAFHAGKLYGTTYACGGPSSSGTVFQIDTVTGALRVMHSFDGADGTNPVGLIPLGNALYGTTSFGGSADKGTVFRLQP